MIYGASTVQNTIDNLYAKMSVVDYNIYWKFPYLSCIPLHKHSKVHLFSLEIQHEFTLKHQAPNYTLWTGIWMVRCKLNLSIDQSEALFGEIHFWV